MQYGRLVSWWIYFLEATFKYIKNDNISENLKKINELVSQRKLTNLYKKKLADQHLKTLYIRKLGNLFKKVAVKTTN